MLAPDAITFEDRRGAVQGTEPGERDWLQHYNAMAYRLLDGDLLMRKCLDDAQRALSVPLRAAEVNERLVGVAVVSGTEDKYSRDADDVVASVGGDFIAELRVDRGHALDEERFEAIVAWLVERVAEMGRTLVDPAAAMRRPA